jgi:hypothetical protein
MQSVVHRPPRRQPLCWQLLVEIEPRLRELEQTILSARLLSQSQFAAERRAVRLELAKLVGWFAGTRDPILASSDSWHVALNHLMQPRRIRPAVAARPMATAPRRCA